MSDKIKTVICPHCEINLDVGSRHFNKEIECPSCGFFFRAFIEGVEPLSPKPAPEISIDPIPVKKREKRRPKSGPSRKLPNFLNREHSFFSMVCSTFEGIVGVLGILTIGLTTFYFFGALIRMFNMPVHLSDGELILWYLIMIFIQISSLYGFCWMADIRKAVKDISRQK